MTGIRHVTLIRVKIGIHPMYIRIKQFVLHTRKGLMNLPLLPIGVDVFI